MRVEFSRRAEKHLNSLENSAYNRAVRAIESLAQDPYPRGAVKVKGEKNVFRVRVGKYRILYEVYEDMVLIVNIEKRSRAYRF